MYDLFRRIKVLVAFREEIITFLSRLHQLLVSVFLELSVYSLRNVHHWLLIMNLNYCRRVIWPRLKHSNWISYRVKLPPALWGKLSSEFERNFSSICRSSSSSSQSNEVETAPNNMKQYFKLISVRYLEEVQNRKEKLISRSQSCSVFEFYPRCYAVQFRLGDWGLKKFYY